MAHVLASNILGPHMKHEHVLFPLNFSFLYT